MNIIYRFSLAVIAAAISFAAMAQPSRTAVQVVVAPQNRLGGASLEHLADAFLFEKGQQANFSVTVLASGVPISVKEASFSLCEDKMPAFKTGKVALHNGTATIKAGTMKQPGFLRCDVSVVVDGTTYKGSSTVGFDAHQLRPTVAMPADFEQWWQAQLAEAAKVPALAQLTLLPEKCTDKVNVYQMRLQAVRKGCHVYGILAMPKAEGRYRAVMRVPGAGIHSGIGGMIAEAEKGMVTLDLGIHGIPLNLPAETYAELSEGALNDYPSIEITSREKYYYRRVYLSAVRAVEYLASLPNVDSEHVYVCGGSQGGALSIVTAALCPKVTAIEAFFPALADQEAYLHGRAGGWPHYFYFHKADPNIGKVAKVVQYYDVANFARILHTPTFMSFGLADLTCAPTSTISTWNVIPATDKQLVVVPETGHWRFPQTWAAGWDFLLRH